MSLCWTFYLAAIAVTGPICLPFTSWSPELPVSYAYPLLHGMVVIQSLMSLCTSYNLYYSSHWCLLQTQDCVSRVTGVSCRPRTVYQESPVSPADPILYVMEVITVFCRLHTSYHGSNWGPLQIVYFVLWHTQVTSVSCRSVSTPCQSWDPYCYASLCLHATAMCLLIACRH